MSEDLYLDFGRMIAALLFVIALMGGLSLILRRLGLSGPAPAHSGRKRLKIIESLPLDARRRLVLVQCDEAQHLVIIGPGGETVIKTDIRPAENAHDPEQARPANDPGGSGRALHSPSPVDASGKS
ncbi:MAG: flagellar biosynthetic protein FliO [Alphaproteobacteria bacterium]|nr:flagellar biosynthetic protein FliO [Alphaproteobacteria bacterium]MCB9974081.1 flagellar biosynthetic protein FliO [Rhodospirillales bacterium]